MSCLISSDRLFSWITKTVQDPLIGPVRNDPTWQAKHHPKFANSNFQIDWDKQVAVCPRGFLSVTKRYHARTPAIINSIAC